MSIQPGDNVLTVSVTDSFGNTNSAAATATVANRGLVLYELQSIAFDPAHDESSRPIASAMQYTLCADPTVTSASSRMTATGPVLRSAASRRCWSMLLTTVRWLSRPPLVSIDLDTGNRTEIHTDTPTPSTSISFGFACNSPCTRIYGIAMPDPLRHRSVLGGFAHRRLAPDLRRQSNDQLGTRLSKSRRHGARHHPVSGAATGAGQGAARRHRGIDLASGNRAFVSSSVVGWAQRFKRRTAWNSTRRTIVC